MVKQTKPTPVKATKKPDRHKYYACVCSSKRQRRSDAFKRHVAICKPKNLDLLPEEHQKKCDKCFWNISKSNFARHRWEAHGILSVRKLKQLAKDPKALSLHPKPTIIQEDGNYSENIEFPLQVPQGGNQLPPEAPMPPQGGNQLSPEAPMPPSQPIEAQQCQDEALHQSEMRKHALVDQALSQHEQNVCDALMPAQEPQISEKINQGGLEPQIPFYSIAHEAPRVYQLKMVPWTQVDFSQIPPPVYKPSVDPFQNEPFYGRRYCQNCGDQTIMTFVPTKEDPTVQRVVIVKPGSLCPVGGHKFNFKQFQVNQYQKKLDIHRRLKSFVPFIRPLQLKYYGQLALKAEQNGIDLDAQVPYYIQPASQRIYTQIDQNGQQRVFYKVKKEQQLTFRSKTWWQKLRDYGSSVRKWNDTLLPDRVMQIKRINDQGLAYDPHRHQLWRTKVTSDIRAKQERIKGDPERRKKWKELDDAERLRKEQVQRNLWRQ